MTYNQNNLKIKNLYDILVCILLVWCALQDFVLCVILRFTGATLIVKLLFHSKDVILLVLFITVLLKNKIPAKFITCCLIYFAVIIIQAFVGMSNGDLEFKALLSSIRGLILLPTLTLIGYGIRNKEYFWIFIKKYYYFLVILAIIGLIEFVADITVGTRTFWMDILKLDNYYISIKGGSAVLENGTPGNWYTDIGAGYRTQKRVISIWAAPLTAGFVLLMPCMYYTIEYFKRRKVFSLKTSKNQFKLYKGFIFTAVALILTFTRQTLLLYIFFAFIIFVYYRRGTNREMVILGAIVCVALGGVLLWQKIIDYMYNGSTQIHIWRLQQAITQMTFWGRGIGSFGKGWSNAVVTESQYLTMMGQLGVITIIPYMVMLVSPIIYCLGAANKMDSNNKAIIYSICFCGIIYVVAGLVSETVSAFTSIAQYYVLIGFIWGYCKNNERYKTSDENQNNSNVFAPVS